MKTHGMTGSKTYRIWQAMLNRCRNKNVINYQHYGGRGIIVCDRWQNSFEHFVEDLGECPDEYSIERVDCNGNYEPDNCVWIHRSAQQANARSAVWYEGQRVRDLMSQYGLKETTVWSRINRGQPMNGKLRGNNMLTFNGMTMNQKDWAKHLGVSPATITRRIKLGLSLSEVLQ